MNIQVDIKTEQTISDIANSESYYEFKCILSDMKYAFKECAVTAFNHIEAYIIFNLFYDTNRWYDFIDEFKDLIKYELAYIHKYKDTNCCIEAAYYILQEHNMHYIDVLHREHIDYIGRNSSVQ